MSYVNINTLEKLEAANIMLAHPEVSFPNRGWSDEDLAPYGYAELHFPLEHPFPNNHEKLVETTPKNIDGKWYIQFEVIPMTEDEIRITDTIKYSDVIAERNQLLLNSDWTQNNDSPLSEEVIELWKAYRQQLRDLTKQSGFPWDIEWPQQP